MEANHLPVGFKLSRHFQCEGLIGLVDVGNEALDVNDAAAFRAAGVVERYVRRGLTGHWPNIER